MKHYVIMGNDFPEGICSTAEKADAVVALKRGEEQDKLRAAGETHGRPRIYWRAWAFEVDALIED
jgi:hypothetical protein